MFRLFVAIRPPRSVREQLLAAMGGVQGARWLEDEQLHLTLRFIGEIGVHQAKDLHAALGAVHFPDFEIALCGIGSFERRGRPVTLWAGVKPKEPVDVLHRKIDQACMRVGLEPDRRAYVPHITLARLGRSSGSLQPLLEVSGGLTSAPFAVSEFRLIESLLDARGATYRLVERYALAAL